MLRTNFEKCQLKNLWKSDMEFSAEVFKNSKKESAWFFKTRLMTRSTVLMKKWEPPNTPEDIFENL